MEKKKIKIAFDLDGVIIDKPPFVPQWLMDRLVRLNDKELVYRFPKTKIERFIRWLSHIPLFRPPIRENLEVIKKLAKEKEIKLYIISSRYNFLNGRTKQWLKKNEIDHCFSGIYINLQNEQPHLFKEEMIKKLKINVFIDDDFPLVNYLKNNNQKVKIYCFKNERDSRGKPQQISSLSGIITLTK